MTVESIQVRKDSDGQFTVVAELRALPLSPQEFEGEGPTLSTALFDLAEQVEQFELEL